eukprot:5308899-Pleurochrysis_carterae.AAC.1
METHGALAKLLAISRRSDRAAESALWIRCQGCVALIQVLRAWRPRRLAAEGGNDGPSARETSADRDCALLTKCQGPVSAHHGR